VSLEGGRLWGEPGLGDGTRLLFIRLEIKSGMGQVAFPIRCDNAVEKRVSAHFMECPTHYCRGLLVHTFGIHL
jgi:hypothetical protein